MLKIPELSITTMLQNYFIKIGRLATGIAVSILISLWMHDELTHSDRNYNHRAQLTQHDWFNGRKEPGGQASKTLLNTKLHNVPKDNLAHAVLSSQKVDYITANVDRTLLKSGRIMEANIRTYFTRELLTHDSLRQGNALSLLQR